MNKIIEQQLKEVKIADLSHFDEENGIFTIPQKKSIKIEQNKSYLIHLNDSFFYNSMVKDNWNKGWEPIDRYLKIDVNVILSNMIKVVSIGYDALNKKDTMNFWTGWICLNDMEVLQTL